MRRDRRRKALWIILLSVLLWTGGGVLCSREIYAAETGADAAEVNTSQGEGGSNEMTEDELISMGIVFSIVLFIVVLFWVITSIDEKNTEKLEQGFAEFDQIIEKYEQAKKGIKENDDLCSILKLQIVDEIEGGWQTIIQRMSEEAQKVFGVHKYLDTAFWEDEFSVVKEAVSAINNVETEQKMQEYRTCRNELASTKGKTKKEKIQKIEECCFFAKKISEDLDAHWAKIHYFATYGSSLSEAIYEGGTVFIILNTDIRYDIRIREITGQGKRRGKMSCRGADGKYQKGIFCLDDITVLGCGKLREVIGGTGIYAFGYSSLTTVLHGTAAEKEGIELRSIREFSCVPLGEEAEAKPEKSALLCPGKEYRLTCRTDKQEASMIVKISE